MKCHEFEKKIQVIEIHNDLGSVQVCTNIDNVGTNWDYGCLDNHQIEFRSMTFDCNFDVII